MTRRVVLFSLLFALLGPGLETIVAPLLLTGFETGDGLPGGLAGGAFGALLIVSGALVIVDSLVRFARQGGGSLSPAAPTQRLVVAGPYRYVRNPIYIATAAVLTGQALLLRQPILLAAAAVYLAAMATLTRLREEPLMRRRFGAQYEDYRAAVRGWWPRSRPWSQPKDL